MKKEEGLRFNSGKTRHDLIPAYAQEQYGKVMTYGSTKYAERNWERGMAWSKVLASLERHLQAIKRGEDFDPETGLLHSAHIMCNAAFITEYYKIYPEGDDRPHWFKKPIKKVYLDIDGILADYESHFLSELKLPEYHPSDWNDYRFRDGFDIIKNDENFWINIPKLIDSEIISYPIEGYCTSRPISNEITQQWLNKNNFPKGELINIYDTGKTKSEVLKNKCDIFIDDCITNFIDCNSNGITCFLMTRPHNKKYDVGHYRVDSVFEFIKKVKND